MSLLIISNILSMGVLNIEIVVKIFKKNLQCAQLFSNNSLEKHRIKNPMGKKLKYSILIMMETWKLPTAMR